MKKVLVKIALIYVALLLVGTAIAAYWIYSGTVTVHVVDYELTLSPSEQTVFKNQYAVFTATLKYTNGTAISGAEIHLLFGNGTDTGVSSTTRSDGTCLLKWNATAVGDFQFKAGYQVP